ncbi:hypothetical protein GIB67_023961 [Kingdonia uniflora]|uniref:Reverse transcriptase zinc-binding domain-containing protein n=1 Tax=Kingdonia uniflora TaxID=39325 RepID=A0A7J7LPC3_9MAGN|nr:hypothetical protein GIB67_023961 [Kingdonia uniflora]
MKILAGLLGVELGLICGGTAGGDVALINSIVAPPTAWNSCNVHLDSIIQIHKWSAPPVIMDFLSENGIHLNVIPICCSDSDTRVWKHDPQGNFSVHSAFSLLNKLLPLVWWFKYTNLKVVHPKIVAFTWRLCRNALATTEDNLIKRGKAGFDITTRIHSGAFIGVLFGGLGTIAFDANVKPLSLLRNGVRVKTGGKSGLKLTLLLQVLLSKRSSPLKI